MKKISSVSILVIVLLFAISTVAADKVVVIPLQSRAPMQTIKTNWINLGIFSAQVDDGAYFNAGTGSFSGIFLPNSGVPSFALGFVIPPDYVSGTLLTLHLLWTTQSKDCSFRVRGNFTSVNRAGRLYISGPSATSGLEIVGGETVYAHQSILYYTQEIQATLSSPDPDVDLEPFDSYNFGFFRSAASFDDTCAGIMMINSAFITYETQ
jgi:hypothetical protein